MCIQRTAVAVASVALLAAQFLFPTPALAADGPPCNPETLRTEQMFNCSMPENLDTLLEFKPASAYADENTRASFPANWRQLGYNQPHQTLFPVSDTAPAFSAKWRILGNAADH